MKQYSKLFSLVVLASATTGILRADDNRVLPHLTFRSQGRDMARKLYGTTNWAVYQPDMEDQTYGTFNMTLQYDQSFRNHRIADCLFGPAIVANNVETPNTNNNCNNRCDDAVIMISGLDAAPVAGATTRGPRELMAENFLLPRDFRSVISFSPKVQDVVVDFNLYVGFARWCNGMYFRLYGPVVWNKVNLRASEDLITAGTPTTATDLGGGYEAGFFDVGNEVPTQALFNSALSYFNGCELPANADRTSEVQPLRFAKFSNNCDITGTTNNSCDDSCNGTSRHKTGFAELRGELGYNYIADNYRFLINLQAAAPTGSKVKAEYLFPAYVGNGHHWELGVGLGGAWRMWCSEDAERSFNFIVEADITHLFKAKQQRTFDLKCKPLSRYMLAQRLEDNADVAATEQLAGDSNAGFQFADEYAPVANISTRNVKVSIGVQGDMVAMFNYSCRGFSWDLGYNFWAISSSKIKLSCDDECNDTCGVVPFPVDTWALKGDASVGGFYPNITTPTNPEGVALAATESNATIFGGVGTGLNINNASIDSAVVAQVNPTGATPPALVDLVAFPTFPGVTPTINTSSDPVFISIDDLDIAGAEQRGLSHKIFTHFSYTWRDCSDRWVPYVGGGVSAEFGSHSGSGDDCDTTTTIECDTCPSSMSCALSKWAVEIKGGVSFH